MILLKSEAKKLGGAKPIFYAQIIPNILEVSYVFNLHLSANLCIVICSQVYSHKIFSMTSAFFSRKLFPPPPEVSKRSGITNFF